MENKKNSILIIDDEKSDFIALSEILSDEFSVYAVKDSRTALATAERDLPDVILLDIIMPEMDGYDVIAQLKDSAITRDIPVVFITGLDNKVAEEKALALGGADYITKPFSSSVVKLRVRNQIKLVNRARMFEQRTDKLLRLQNSMTSILVHMVESHDRLTGKHLVRTAEYLKILVHSMLKKGIYLNELKEWDLDIAVSSSRLHDIGKLTISEAILNKTQQLTKGDYEAIKLHTSSGEKIINSIIAETGEEDFLRHAKLFAGYHHERWDGNGYPRNLSGEQIPLHGRILAVADVYDALISERPYKPAYSHRQAMKIIKDDSGSKFDPQIVEVFAEVSDLFACVP
ncbi:MAG: response regulator [Firmicutes bacterium]|nr:response regulator [Bacillota bacterium]